MFKLKFENENESGKVYCEIIAVKLEKTAKQYAKEFCRNHPEYKIIAVSPC